jgi:hypothetical protein
MARFVAILLMAAGVAALAVAELAAGEIWLGLITGACVVLIGLFASAEMRAGERVE